MTNSTITRERIPSFRPEVFEEAREAVITLRNLRKYLTPAELETLEILLDKKIVRQLSKSLKEAKREKSEPFENILKLYKINFSQRTISLSETSKIF